VTQEIFPILTTPDLSRALAFYRDALDGEITYRFPADGEPQYVSLRFGASSLGIAAQPADSPPSPQSGVAGPFALWAYVDACDATVERLRAAGVPVLEPPVDQPWGERMATVADPDGNRVMVAARPVTS
jgi:lactoylglutathione lyase